MLKIMYCYFKLKYLNTYSEQEYVSCGGPAPRVTSGESWAERKAALIAERKASDGFAQAGAPLRALLWKK